MSARTTHIPLRCRERAWMGVVGRQRSAALRPSPRPMRPVAKLRCLSGKGRRGAPRTRAAGIRYQHLIVAAAPDGPAPLPPTMAALNRSVARSPPLLAVESRVRGAPHQLSLLLLVLRVVRCPQPAGAAHHPHRGAAALRPTAARPAAAARSLRRRRRPRPAANAAARPASAAPAQPHHGLVHRGRVADHRGRRRGRLQRPHPAKPRRRRRRPGRRRCRRRRPRRRRCAAAGRGGPATAGASSGAGRCGGGARRAGGSAR